MFCTMVLLTQNKQGHTTSSETVDWLTLLHSMVSEIVNVVGNVRTLDSALLEVSKPTDNLLHQYQVRKTIKTLHATDPWISKVFVSSLQLFFFLSLFSSKV
jgi:hypothetical protein